MMGRMGRVSGLFVAAEYLDTQDARAPPVLPRERCVVWRLPKVAGGSDPQLRVVVTLKQDAVQQTAALRRRIGPVQLQFVVPRYNASGLQVRYLQVISQAKGYNPQRWVRYALQAVSYVQRL